MIHQCNTISVFYFNAIMWHHRNSVIRIMWQVWHWWVTLFRIFFKNISFFFFKNFESVKISVFVVWSECQFNVKNVYFEKSKFSTKIWNFDTKKNFKKFVYQHQINNLQLNFNLELTHVCVITNYKITFSENRFSNIHIHFS